MTRLGRASVNQNTDQLKNVRLDGSLWIRKVLHFVGGHVDAIRELKFVVYLAPCQRHHVKVKPLQVEDQVVRDVL